MNDLTSDYATVKARPARFSWGRVVRWHDVGRYSILEFNPFSDASTPDQLGAYQDTVRFYVYVDKSEQRTSCSSLDAALLTAVAIGNLEINHARHMATACLKVLGLEP